MFRIHAWSIAPVRVQRLVGQESVSESGQRPGGCLNWTASTVHLSPDATIFDTQVALDFLFDEQGMGGIAQS